MTEVMSMPMDSIEGRSDRQSERTDMPLEEDDLPPPPPPPPPPPSRRDRDSRERRDERDRDREIDMDRPPLARGGSRDYHDRGNRSPPPPPRERDRERDYKRRLSPSPPPYYRDRDRRHSPPPYKRSRRDDGYRGYGYDRRRSPRGGYAGDDRRFGYDYAGGYEHGVGGRSGYVEERPRGRFTKYSSGGYQSGPPDWDSGQAGYGAGSMQREGLMSYKQFIQELEDDILPAEAERRYQEYRSEYISTQKRAFFDTHKDEEWLRDKYHPTNLLAVIEKRNEHAKKTAKEFLLDLQSGVLDLAPGRSASSSGNSGQASDPNSEDEAEGGSKRRRHGRGPAKENDLLVAPTAHPISSEPRRIQIDIEQAHALVCKLDKEKGIEDNILSNIDHDTLHKEKSHGGSLGQIVIVRGLTIVKGLEGTELLDTLITYLWRIHGVDYYGMIETNEAKGFRHVRGESKNNNEIITAGTDWEKKLDSFWQGRLLGQDPLEVMTSKEKIDAAASELLDPHVKKIRDEKYGWKYGCGAMNCVKLFHATEFVQKHLRLKHPDLVMELTSKLREDLYFQNYMNDADAPGGKPIMQQPLLKEKPHRRRPLLDNRIRDERGHRREHERVDRVDGDERYDSTENSPSRDLPSKTDDQEGRKTDDSKYDSYGGQGMDGVSTFSSDIPPPPVLMPVPGAGPLGPFVAAPRDIAMKVLTEQSGPSRYESNGRIGRNGPQSSRLASRLGPGLGCDPRRIRSYQDLDAPEDEVTVIDYRSLEE